MTAPNESHEPVNVADLDDRLMDRALAELVGGDTPPDLLERILTVRAAAPTGDRRTPLAWAKPLLAVAALLLVACTITLFLTGSPFQVSWRSASSAKLDRSSSTNRDRGRTIDRQGTSNDAPTPVSGEAANGPWESSQEIRQHRQTSISQYKSSTSKAIPFYDTPVDEKSVASKQETINVELMDGSSSGDQSAQLSVGRRSREVSQLTPRDFKLAERMMSKSTSGGRGGQWGFPYRSQDSNRPFRQGSFDTEGAGFADRFGSDTSQGTGPGSPGDQYTRIYENPFVKAVGGDAVSTFSIDVDTASYANVRQFLREMRQLPPPDAVRIEELVNYFDYDYAGPGVPAEPFAYNTAMATKQVEAVQRFADAPFAAHVEVAGCPWAPEHRLVRIGVKGREIEQGKRPPSNLVFLVDVSGSMDEPNKLPLVVDGLRQLTRELGENDRVAIVVYASSEGLALPSTRGDQQQTILDTLDRLRAGGSTAGGAGIQLAYQIAEDHFIPGGTNRVVLCTDGDFNVGVTSTAELERLVAQKAKDTKVFLSVLGFGRGNLNDAMMQTIADRGNGNHHYVDNLREARKVLVEEMTGTLITIAKDVKLQVEFNPAHVAAYRLIGYENRLLRTKDFNDDTKDAGEIGAGHAVTALYEVIPAGVPADLPAVDELKYQSATAVSETAQAAASDELLTLKMRYKEPEGDVSRKLEWPVIDTGTSFDDASDDFQFAAAVAEFGLLLRDSQFKGHASFDRAAEIAAANLKMDLRGYRSELVELIHRAGDLRADRQTETDD